MASIVNSSKPAQDGRPARKEHYIYNAVGHSVLLVNGDCTPVQVNLFEAFGGIEQTWGNSDNNRLANTKERDASIALDNHGFRYYDASIGRYISNDPIGYEGGFNLYVHCTNDPVNKFDPLGLKEKEDLEKQHKKIEDRAQKIRDRIKEIDDKAQSGELSGKALRKAERELKSEYKLYLNDLGKAGELAKAYTDSKWFPDSELAGKHMGYAVTFDGLELDRGNVKTLGKILETEAKFGESIHDAAGRYAAAGYTMKGLEYAGDGAGLLLGAGAIGMAGKQLLKMGLKEGGKQLLKTKLRDEVIERGKNLVLDEVADIAGMTPEQRMAMQLAVSVGQSKLSGKLGAAGGGKQRNKPVGADPAANGAPHTVIERPGPSGQYTTYNGDGTWKQYRGSGKEHGGIPRPNVKETVLNTRKSDGKQFLSNSTVRPPRPDEIPGGN